MTMAVLASPPASWGDRVWFSKTWRLAAAGTLLALLGVDRWAGAWSPVAGSGPAAPAVAEVEAVAALSGEIGLSSEQVRRLVARVEFVQLTAQEPRGAATRALQ
jgi:hypothetical protein